MDERETNTGGEQMSKDSESENERLGREWMALPHWGGWRKGMISNYGWLCMQDGEPPASGQEFIPTGYPDLDHPGTRAFLLEDVRKAWGEPELSCAHSRDCGWMVVDRGLIQILIIEPAEPTEQAALMAALRAAPEKTK